MQSLHLSKKPLVICSCQGEHQGRNIAHANKEPGQKGGERGGGGSLIVLGHVRRRGLVSNLIGPLRANGSGIYASIMAGKARRRLLYLRHFCRRGPLIQARHAAPVAPPLPPGSPTKQQESAASFAALLEGLANFGSDPAGDPSGVHNTNPLPSHAKSDPGAAGLRMLNNKEHRPAVQTAATPGLDAKASRRSEKVDILAERFGRKHGAEAFLPGSEGVVLDVRTMRLEPNFSPFAAGIRE